MGAVLPAAPSVRLFWNGSLVEKRQRDLEVASARFERAERFLESYTAAFVADESLAAADVKAHLPYVLGRQALKAAGHALDVSKALMKLLEVDASREDRGILLEGIRDSAQASIDASDVCAHLGVALSSSSR